MDLSGILVDLDYGGFIWTLWWTLILKVIVDLLVDLFMDLDIEGYSGFIWTHDGFR